LNEYPESKPTPSDDTVYLRHARIRKTHRTIPKLQLTMEYNMYTPREVMEPNSNDVLCGRGGGTNNNKGNMNWRGVVALNKELYTTLPVKEKVFLSRSIVSAVRTLDPPGRFLQKDTKSDTWYDIGDELAHQKTSQALRVRLSNPEPTIPSPITLTEPSQPKLMAISSQPPATIPIPGNGENPHLMPGFPTHVSVITPSRSNAVSTPRGPAPEGPSTLTERGQTDLGGDISSGSLMSLTSFVDTWRHPNGDDPLTAIPTTVSSPVHPEEHRGAGLKPAAQGNGSHEAFSNGLGAGADPAVGLVVPVPAGGGLMEPGLFSDMLSVMSIRSLTVQNTSISFENIPGMSWQDSPSLGTIGTGLASLSLATEDLKKLVNDCGDQKPIEALERSRANFKALRNEPCF
jgi:hypothetical protein